MPVVLGVNALNNVVGSASPVGGLTGGVLGGSSGSAGSGSAGNSLQNGISSKCS